MSKKQDEVNQNRGENEEVEEKDLNQETEVSSEAESEQTNEQVESSEEKSSEESKSAETLLLEAGQTIQTLNAKIKDMQDQYLRLRAEFDNYRKRVSQDVDNHKIKGIGLAIEAFFPTMDGLDKALKMCKDEEFLKGLTLVKKQFETALNKLGVVEIDPLDEEFNPEYHNAVMNETNPEKVGIVTEVFQKGYRYKDTLLRPAMVKVGIEE